MSGRYRYEPSNGWLWILPPVGPSFASVYEKSASGADSNTRAVREIVIELNRLLDRAVYAESHRLTAETALDEAIARADKASNALIRTTAALRETTDRAEKAEARVAELEREVAAWSPARHYEEEESDWQPKGGGSGRIYDVACPVHGIVYLGEEWGASSPPVLLGVSCLKCGWKSGPVGRFTVTEVDQAAKAVTISSEPITKPAKVDDNFSKYLKDEAWAVVGESPGGEPYTEGVYATEATARDVADARNVHRYLHDRLSVEKVWVDAKTAPKTPVPAPEGTEAGQKAPPPSPAGAPRSDQGAGIKSDTQSAGPVLGHSRASESSNLDTLAFGKSVPVPPARSCEGCKGVTDSPEASLCPTCRLWWLKQGFAEVEEPRPVVSCSDARCQCYQCVKDRADEEEDFAQLAKEQAKRATTRVEASPAAAAEVEARTGAWVGLQGYSFPFPKMLPPRAGLPSRDEVAAFLEARWPKGWRVNVRDVRIYK